MGKSRYVARYFCSLNDPDATDTWFLIDRRTGVPVFKDGSLQLFGRKEVRALLAQPDAIAGPAVDAEEGMATMSETFREGGSELYVGTNGREHD